MNRTTSVICALIIVIITTKVTGFHSPDAAPQLLQSDFVNAVDADHCRRRYADEITRALAENSCQQMLVNWNNLPLADKRHCEIAQNAGCKLKLVYCGLWWTSRCSFQCSSINNPTATKRVFAASLARPLRVLLQRIYPQS